MLKEKQVYYLEKSDVVELEEILKGAYLEDFKDNQVLYHLTFSFHNDFDNDIEADIDICNGDSKELSSPYVFVQWLRNGVYFCDQVKKQILGIHNVIEKETGFMYEIEVKIKE